MKINCINILLISVSLNILVNTHKKTSITPRHTPKIQTTRLLCECELYSPANYDNDPEMNEVIENFNKQTQQRLHEYDERMKTIRQKCIEQCDKEIQKIILKDKLEKQMAEQLTTLDTKITTDDIPTCICEKSMADKVEKGCLRCGGVLGGGVMPSIGLLGGIGEGAISVLQPLALKAATEEAIAEATALATQTGMNAVRHEIKVYLANFINEIGFVDFTSVVNEANFKSATALYESVVKLLSKSCKFGSKERGNVFCNTIEYSGVTPFNGYTKAGATTYEATLTTKTTVLTEAKVGSVKATYAGYHTSIIACIVAILVIVLVMVIIYLILRYRRKKKMKKKLKYIKLLKE
ncbi:rifin [Plasmodium falciparum RAJ116]|uniref:Rifin n=1 Tax=Plasmodium falciparum RAJ116 TaxID=580058 RepID=A0A0L0CYG0_PLAFA|nr:rifin [Plasmodium falciparum RAJ116]